MAFFSSYTPVTQGGPHAQEEATHAQDKRSPAAEGRQHEHPRDRGQYRLARTTVHEYVMGPERPAVLAAASGHGRRGPGGQAVPARERRGGGPPAGTGVAGAPPGVARGRHVTLRLLWLEWKQDHPDGWGYTQFCGHYKAWLGAQDVVMRLSYRPGEKMFVDFSGDRMGLVDPTTGEAGAAEVFVAVLGCAGLLYVEATRGQDLGSWLMAHVRAYEYYGGVTVATTPDNLKSGVSKACFYDPEINPSYLELARHYGTVVLPTRVARPRDKAAVEAGVLSAERWVLAPLRNRRFFSLAEMNKAIAEKLAELNARSL